MSKVLRILAVCRLGFTATLAQTPGKIGAGEGAAEIKIGRRFCYVRCDGEIGRLVWRERVLRRRGRLQSQLGRERRARGRPYQCGYQCPVWHALVELLVCVASCPQKS